MKTNSRLTVVPFIRLISLKICSVETKKHKMRSERFFTVFIETATFLSVSHRYWLFNQVFSWRAVVFASTACIIFQKCKVRTSKIILPYLFFWFRWELCGELLKIFTGISYHLFFGDYTYNQQLKPTLALLWVIAVVGAAGIPAIYKHFAETHF